MKHSTKCLLGYLKSWHATSTQKQRDAGHYVDLTFIEFLNLFTADHLQKLRIALMDGKITRTQNENNARALVLTWRNYAARSSGEFTSETTFVCTRAKSFEINRSQTGDKLRADHVENIRESLTGLAKTDAHRAAISEASKGKSKAPWSEERRANARVKAAAREAAKRAVR